MKLQLVDLVWPCLACILLCTIVNLFYFPRATVFPDEQRFLGSALRLATSGEFWVGKDRAWEMPGTALFFAPFVWLLGPHGAILPIRFAQCHPARAPMRPDRLHRAPPVRRQTRGGARRRLDRRRLSVLSILSGPAAERDAVRHADAWRHRRPFLVARARHAYRYRACRRLPVLCRGDYVKSTLTVLPPLLLAASAWIMGANWRRSAAILAVAVCLYGAFMSPWWIRNANLFHAFVPFGTNAGENFYLGNNPHNRDAGIDWASDVEPDVVATTLGDPGRTRARARLQQAGDRLHQGASGRLPAGRVAQIRPLLEYRAQRRPTSGSRSIH